MTKRANRTNVVWFTLPPKSHLPFPNAQNMSGEKEEKRGEAGLEIYLGKPEARYISLNAADSAVLSELALPTKGPNMNIHMSIRLSKFNFLTSDQTC